MHRTHRYVRGTKDNVIKSVAKALEKIIQKPQITTVKHEHTITVGTVYKVTRAVSKAGEYTVLRNILEVLETLTAPQFDPFNPPPPAKWVEVLTNVGKYLATAILITSVGLAIFAINIAQGSLKGPLEKWYQSQPVVVILILIVCLTLLTVMAKPYIDKLSPKSKN